MNSHNNANNLFKFEQDLSLRNTQSNMFGKWGIVSALSDVHSSVGKKIGEIKSIVTDSETSIIEYVIFQFDRVFGLGEKNYLLPWGKFNTGNPRKVVFIPVGLKTLSNAPSFHQSRWPVSTEGYLKDVNEYWGRN